MKKWLGLVLALAVLFAASLALADVNIAEGFPDEIFRQYAERYDWNMDGILSTEEASRVEEIYCSGEEIKDLTGIEYFKNLRGLYCAENGLKSLDLSRNVLLEELECGNNALTSLNISGCTALVRLCCEYNKLKELDVSGCPALKELICSGNSLKSLPLGSKPDLVRIKCSYNALTALDVSGCPALEEFDCANNKIKTLKMSSHPALKILKCSYNSMSLPDLSAFTALEELECSSIGVRAIKISGLALLNRIECWGNNLISMELSDLPALRELTCARCGLRKLNVSGLPALEVLDCESNKLTELALGSMPVLERIDCSSNKLTKLDLSGCPSLTSLSCYLNKLTKLDLTPCPKLTYLSCLWNKLTKLDISNCPELTKLDCGANSLTKLDVSGNTALEEILCSGNQLKELKTGKAPGLKKLHCEDNKLTKLNVSGYPALEELNCSNNRIRKLDISACQTLCGYVSSYKRENNDSVPCYDSFGYSSLRIDYSATVKAGKKTSKPLKLYNKVKEVVDALISQGMSEHDKALKLHDWVINHAYYDLTYSIYTPSGVLLKGTGVCQSYAEAYYLLLDEAGITNMVVSGSAGSGSHAWNYARIDGTWWHIDTTWDDPIGGPNAAVSGLERRKYFMMTSAQIKRDHYWYTSLPGDSESQEESGEVILGGLKYELDYNERTATVIGVQDKNAGKLTIPSTIEVSGIKYKVTDIADSALKGLKKLKELTIGKNVEAIGANAFNGCKALKKITVKTEKLIMDNIGANAFRNISKKAVIKCPKKQKAKYEKIFRQKGVPKKAKFK